jgi:hypothetical protein
MERLLPGTAEYNLDADIAHSRKHMLHDARCVPFS